MSHFGRAGPPDITDTYSVLVLNITFRTTADDLFPPFDKYGKVVDVFIPRDSRTGDSRGFAFVRYKHAYEAQKAVEKLDGRVVDGRDMMVIFSKYRPDAERSHEPVLRSRSPRPSCSRHRDEYRGDRYEGDRNHRRGDRDRYRSRTPSRSSEYHRGHRRSRDDDYSRSPSRTPVGGPLPRRTPSSQSLTLNIYVNFVNPGNN